MNYIKSINNKKNAFKKLPSTTNILSINFKEEIDKIYTKENEEKLKEMLIIIYDKINTNNKEYHWTIDNYKEFKKEILKVDVKDLNILITSIEKSLLTSNSEIYKQLKSFSDQTDWYPIKERVKDEKNNRYIYLEKELSVSDCFYIINNLNSHIKQYIGNYFYDINSEQELNIKLNEIKNDFLKGYIKRYSYLKNYPLFIDIYINGYKELLKRLSQMAYRYKNDTEYQKDKYFKWGSHGNNQNSVSLRKYQKHPLPRIL